MSEAVLVTTYKNWEPKEKQLYAGAQVRVLGETDHDGRLLCELMSGPLRNERRWFSEAELVRTNEGE